MPPLDSIIDTITDIVNQPIEDTITEATDAITSGLDGLIPGTTITDNDLLQSQYDFNYKVFPSDLGNENVGHYMVININVPVEVRNQSAERTSFGQFQELLPGDASKVDVLRFGTGVNNFGGEQREALSRPRYTRRIRESIALHMPAALTHTTFNDYEDVSLTALGGGLLAGVAQTGAAILGSGLGSFFGPGGAAAGAAAGSNLAGAVGSFLNTAATVAGYPINPRVEVLFATTRQKSYMFEVLLTPRNRAESIAVNQIVKTLRFHAAPEIDPTFGGFTFIPPAEFDITFFKDGKENLSIPRINTCVMERIDVDYAPLGGIYTTFEDGTPVGVRLSMGFREVEIPHKLRILQGF